MSPWLRRTLVAAAVATFGIMTPVTTASAATGSSTSSEPRVSQYKLEYKLYPAGKVATTCGEWWNNPYKGAGYNSYCFAPRSGTLVQNTKQLGVSLPMGNTVVSGRFTYVTPDGVIASGKWDGKALPKQSSVLGESAKLTEAVLYVDGAPAS